LKFQMYTIYNFRHLAAVIIASCATAAFGSDAPPSLSDLIYGWTYEVVREYSIHEKNDMPPGMITSGVLKAIVTIDKKGQLHCKAINAQGAMNEELVTLDRGYMNYGHQVSVYSLSDFEKGGGYAAMLFKPLLVSHYDKGWKSLVENGLAIGKAGLLASYINDDSTVHNLTEIIQEQPNAYTIKVSLTDGGKPIVDFVFKLKPVARFPGELNERSLLGNRVVKVYDYRFTAKKGGPLGYLTTRDFLADDVLVEMQKDPDLIRANNNSFKPQMVAPVK
jgi:hypothetical protein